MGNEVYRAVLSGAVAASDARHTEDMSNVHVSALVARGFMRALADQGTYPRKKLKGTIDQLDAIVDECERNRLARTGND